MNKKHAINPTFCFTDIRELIEWSSYNYADKTAFSYRISPRDAEPVKVSFSELGNDVRALASRLAEMGCTGKHCVLIGKLSYEWALTYYAVLSIGGVLVPLDKDWSDEELADTVKKADGAYIFGDDDISEKINNVAKLSGVKSVYYLHARADKKSLRSLVEAGRDVFEKAPGLYYNTPINPLNMALLVFTSGTTGKGKGVMLSQTAILSDMYNAVHYLDYGKNTVGILPPHHTYGSTVMLVGHNMIGAEVYISSGVKYITRELGEQKPEHLVLVPLYLETFYRKIIANLKEKDKLDTVTKAIRAAKSLKGMGVDIRKKVFGAIHEVFGGNLKMIICGGAPLSREVFEFYDGIGIPVVNGYGITECAPLISFNRSKNIIPGSVGNVIDDAFVKIDEPNEDGEGEILFKGANVMLGYYKDDAATADAFKNGYFRTGDYGKLGKKGEIYITGRKKNLIILSNGKNVYPEEIENELSAVPGILDIVVYEGQSLRGLAYNAIVAEIYPDADYFAKNGIELNEEYFKKYIEEFNKKTVPYKKIGILKLRSEEFPKNTLRKIMRFKIDMTID